MHSSCQLSSSLVCVFTFVYIAKSPNIYKTKFYRYICFRPSWECRYFLTCSFSLLKYNCCEAYLLCVVSMFLVLTGSQSCSYQEQHRVICSHLAQTISPQCFIFKHCCTSFLARIIIALSGLLQKEVLQWTQSLDYYMTLEKSGCFDLIFCI